MHKTHRVSIVLLTLVAATVLAASACAQSPAPQVTSGPQEIQPPANEQLFLQLHAKGDQIYTCKETSAGQFAWTLKAPEAQLFDDNGKLFGKHFAGPSWQAADGSTLVGKAVANVSHDPDSIPWLLINVVNRSGEGVLSKVTSIQRINTKGGKAPVASCDSTHAGQEQRAAYTADYRFFAPK